MGNTLKILIFLATFAASASAEARVIDRTAALVNSDVITLSDVGRFRNYFNLRKEIDPFVAFFNFSPKSPRETIDYLVQESLVLQKFPASKADVDEEVQAVLKKNNIELEALKGILKNQNVTFDVYESLMGVSIAKRKLMDRELRPLAVVTEDEVKNFYYTDPAFIERKRKQKLLLSYDLAQMRIEGKALSAEIADKLRGGEDFDSIAQRYVDKGVRTTPLGVLREDKLAEPIRASLESLKVGETSKPISLGENLFVIHKVNSISAPHDPVFEREKAQIQGILYQKAMERQLTLWSEREKRNAFVHVPE